MSDILTLSARYIDEDIYEGPGSVNRATTELSEIADDIALVEAFSHVVALRTGDGLLLFDTSLHAFADGILKSLRGWSREPVHTVAFTHGHVDHVGGCQAFIDEARANGAPRPRIVGHDNVAARYDRYDFTNGYNAIINERQFSPAPKLALNTKKTAERPTFGPKSWVRPDTTFSDRLQIKLGDLSVNLRHAIGETDDHLWAWIPEHKAICTGDFVTWVFPNAGNPQKVQRYPLEWAKALREMSALDPELLLPAHGLPIAGRERIRTVLDTIAGALESLVHQSVSMMNDGARLDDIIHSVSLPSAYMDKPYLRPMYDEPEFLVRNIWRLYGGWYDGNPARLKPAPDEALAKEIAELAGGGAVLTQRAQLLSDQGEHRLACHLVELATQAESEDRAAHGARAEIYMARRKAETSMMAKGIFATTARESEAKSTGNK
jgi:alkyl sulfatase BDS1-like metallo-beta-lactamase superfamily hydrolase